MLVRLHARTTRPEMDAVRATLCARGYRPQRITLFDVPVFAAVPEDGGMPQSLSDLAGMAGVAAVVAAGPAQLGARALRPEGTRVRVAGVEFGGQEFPVIAGPCSVESRDQILATAEAVRAAGGHLLRGGAFKPRTSTYSFQGLGRHGLELLAEARARTGLGVVTEVLATEDVSLVAEYADMLQVGARNMQNFALLKQLGRLRKPVLLKRGAGATLEEWLAAAEYLLARGNDQVVLCERGIRTFETYTRNTLDISAVAAVRELTHLPIIVDPSHATGRSSLVASAAKAALAAGADGLCIEIHADPAQALTDREQALGPAAFTTLMEELARIAPAVDRTLAPALALAE